MEKAKLYLVRIRSCFQIFLDDGTAITPVPRQYSDLDDAGESVDSFPRMLLWCAAATLSAVGVEAEEIEARLDDVFYQVEVDERRSAEDCFIIVNSLPTADPVEFRKILQSHATPIPRS